MGRRCLMRCAAIAALLAAMAPVLGAARLPNVLHLVSDDMRPQLSCYGHPEMKTPNLCKLAATGLQFDFAYTQFAYCAPSRNSFMSGRRPERTKVVNFLHTFRQLGGANWTAMPQFFKKHGYFTSSAGKIYHDGQDDPASWTYPSNQTKWIHCGEGDDADPLGNYCGLTNASKVPYTDEDLALDEGLKRMRLAHASGKPFWVSVGIHRPHTNYRVPPGFYGPEVYPPGPNDVVKPPRFPGAPVGAPFMSGNWEGGDINDPAHGCPDCIIPSNRSVEYRRWYMAAVTYADHMLGKALDLLDELGLADSTITVFHSDHGYQLGELNEWSKKTDTELAVHVPMIVRVPWKAASIGKRTTAKMELVDLYRTLANLAGLSEPEASVQGTSMAPVFDNPEDPPAELAAKMAFSQIGRCGCKMYPSPHGLSHECGDNACCRVPTANFTYMGYTLRNTGYRFTAWVPFDGATARGEWGDESAIAMELFDLRSDDGRDFDFPGYSLNVADKNPAVVAQLFAALKAKVASFY